MLNLTNAPQKLRVRFSEMQTAITADASGNSSTTYNIGPQMFAKSINMADVFDMCRLIWFRVKMMPFQSLGDPGLYVCYMDYRGDNAATTIATASVMQGAITTRIWDTSMIEWRRQDARDDVWVDTDDNHFRSQTAGEYHTFCVVSDTSFGSGSELLAPIFEAEFEYTGMTGN